MNLHRSEQQNKEERESQLRRMKEAFLRDGYPSWVTVFMRFLYKQHGDNPASIQMLAQKTLKKDMKLCLIDMHPDKFKDARDIALAELQFKDFLQWKENRGTDVNIAISELLHCSNSCSISDSKRCEFCSLS